MDDWTASATDVAVSPTRALAAIVRDLDEAHAFMDDKADSLSAAGLPRVCPPHAVVQGSR